MAIGNLELTGELAQVMALFRAGRSKTEIAKELGKDKTWVKNAIAKAVRERTNRVH